MPRLVALAVAASVCACAHAPRAPPTPTPTPTATEHLRLLLASADRDGDGRITRADEARGPLGFEVATSAGALRVEGAERLAHVADLLAQRAEEAPASPAVLDRVEVLRPRSEILRVLIRRSWWRLARRADRVDELLAALTQWRLRSKDGRYHLYFPESDPEAGRVLAAGLKSLGRGDVDLHAVPRVLDAAAYAQLEEAPGLLYLPQPYVVPGGHFAELYGWDSYFMARGALADGHPELAANMVEDLLYQIERYGKIGNSNRSIHRSRSQPPFLPAFALAVAETLPTEDARRALLARTARAAAQELAEVWLAPPRLTETGLSRYRDEMSTPLPEVRTALYTDWRPDSDYLAHQRAVRESGWDMTHRFGERGHAIVPVDLNALLYRYERDLAEIHRRLEGPGSPEAARLEQAAAERRARIERLCWDEQRGLFFDYDPDRRAHTDYEHLGSFYALWAGLASPEQARRIVENLPLFEMPGGLAVSSERSRKAAGGDDLQWDWPAGWAPHQVLAVEGLRRYGYAREAERVSLAWLSMLLEVAGAHDGKVKEKYDVVGRTADVSAEYGNQGGDRGPLARYAPECRAWPREAACVRLDLSGLRARPIGFGWTNASYSLLLDGLSPEARRQLDR